MKKRAVAAAVATVVVTLGTGSASGADYIYWGAGSLPMSDIGRANLDGSGVQENFIPSAYSGPAPSIMLDSTSIFWTDASATNDDSLAIKKRNLDGTGASSIVNSTPNTTQPGKFNIRQMSLRGSHFYFPAADRKVGRAGVDGSSATILSPEVFDQTRGANIGVVASDGSHLYVPSQTGGLIARLALDGTIENPSCITGVTWTGAGLAAAAGYVYWKATQTTIGRARSDCTGTADNTFLTVTDVRSVTAAGEYVYWSQGPLGTPPRTIGRVRNNGSTDMAPDWISGLSATPDSLTITPGSGAEPTPTPAPAPTPTSTAGGGSAPSAGTSPNPGPAVTLAPPTLNRATPGRNAVVTVRVQLEKKGKYTFIFERSTSNEMSREQATSARVSMQKGSKIGKRLLKKAVTAAVITTTEDNAKLVTRALLRKAQAKKLNLRVIYAPTGTAQSESVITIK